MKEITRVNHVGLRITNLAVAREFYEHLGFVFIIGPIGPEPVAIMEHPSGVNINFILNASEGTKINMLMDVSEKHTGFTHVALEVTDLGAAQAELERLGVAITEGPITTPQGASFIFIRDPDDNVLEFHQPAA
jgi:lactoylglutathione lyase